MSVRKTTLIPLWKQTVNRKAGIPVKYTVLSLGLASSSAGAGNTVQRTAAQALSGHRVVRTTDATVVDYCDAGTGSHQHALLGVTAESAAAGTAVNVQTSGALTELAWSWTPGLPIFCGLGGVLTQSFSPAWAWSRIVAWAQSPTVIWIDPQDSTKL
jgi:hypothetical protein